MSYKTQRKLKIRYDRIISVIVIFILAVYVVKQLFGNEVKEEIPTLASGSDSEEFKLLYISVLLIRPIMLTPPEILPKQK